MRNTIKIQKKQEGKDKTRKGRGSEQIYKKQGEKIKLGKAEEVNRYKK